MDQDDRTERLRGVCGGAIVDHGLGEVCPRFLIGAERWASLQSSPDKKISERINDARYKVLREVFDAGTTESSRRYFVMELERGGSSLRAVMNGDSAATNVSMPLVLVGGRASQV